MTQNNQHFNFSPVDPRGGPSGVETMDNDRRDKAISRLRQAKHWWDERADFRRRRSRSRDYRKGDQWGETTTDEDGNEKTEKEIIEEQGRIPWVINQIATVTRNLIGQWRQNRSDRAAFAVEKEDSQATEQMNVKRRGTRRHNRAEIVERDQFEEHVLSGASAFKVTIDWQHDLGRNEVEIDPVDQARLFYNLDLEDRRMKNLRIIGELHDVKPNELLATYAKDRRGDFDREKAEQIQHAYSNLDQSSLPGLEDHGFERTDSLSFYSTPDSSHARVIEIWEKRHRLQKYAHDRARGTLAKLGEGTTMEDVERLNAERGQGIPEIEVRTKAEPTWVVHHMTPRGDVLFEQETPYWHGKHPYVVALANLVDGETWGLIEQIIDPQRWLNRLVAMIDHGMGAGAKGVLMVPEEAIPKELTLDDFAEEWSQQGGVIKIKAKKGAQIPQEITTNSIKPGSFDLLQQLKAWIEQTSGVQGAQLGEEPPSDTPAMLFQQQVMQSSLTNLDYFQTFFEGVREMDWKTVQCIQQAISRPIQLNEGATESPVTYQPEDVRELRFDVSMGTVKDTATFQQIFEEDLRTFLESGYIDFGTFLQMSAHPKADTLLRVLQQRDSEVLGLGATEMQAAMSALTEQQGDQAASAAQVAGDGAQSPQAPAGPSLPNR